MPPTGTTRWLCASGRWPSIRRSPRPCWRGRGSIVIAMPRPNGLLRRAAFAGQAVDLSALATLAATDAKGFKDLDLAAHLPWAVRQAIDRDAPGSAHRAQRAIDAARVRRRRHRVGRGEAAGAVRTGRNATARSEEDAGHVSPAGAERRPVQTTQDLKSFWATTYQEVRKELRGRYPRHPWPDDPWTAHAHPPHHEAPPLTVLIYIVDIICRHGAECSFHRPSVSSNKSSCWRCCASAPTHTARRCARRSRSAAAARSRSARFTPRSNASNRKACCDRGLATRRPQRGGKRKRHYEVAAPGLRAVQASYRSLRNMADGLEKLLGEPA